MLNSHDSSDDDDHNDNDNDNDDNDDNDDDDDDDIYNVDAVKGSYTSKKPSVEDTSDIDDEEEEEEQDTEVVGFKRAARESVAPQMPNKKRAAPKPPVHSDSEEDDDDREGDQKENAPSSSAPPTAGQMAPTNTALSDHEEDEEGFGGAEKEGEQDEPSLVAASFSLKQNNAQKSVLGTSMQISMPSSSSTKDAAAQGHESGGDDDEEEEGQDVCKKSKKKPARKAQKGQSEEQRGNDNTTVKKRCGRARGQHSETVVGCGVESAIIDTEFMNNMTIAVKVPGKTKEIHMCNFMSFVEKSQWTVTRAEFALPEGATKHFAPWAVGASEEGVLGIPAVPFPFEDFIAKEKIDQQPILCNDDLDFIRHCAAATISCQRPASIKEKGMIVLFLRVKLIQPSEDAAHFVLDAWHTFCLRQAGLVCSNNNSAAKKECEVLLQLSKESFHHITNKPSVVTSFFTKDVFSLGTSNVSYIQQNRQNTLFDDNEFDPPFKFKFKRQTSDAVSSSKRSKASSAAGVNKQTITSMAQGTKSSKEIAAPPPPLETSQQPSSSSSTYAQAHATCDSDGDEFGSGNYNETATPHKKPATSSDEQLSDESNETTTLVSTGRVESHLAIDFPGLPDLIKESEKKIAFHDAQIKLHQENRAYNQKVLDVLTQCT